MNIHIQQLHDYKCLKEEFVSANSHDQQCYIASNFCEQTYLYSNYISMTYCYLHGNYVVALVCSGFIGYLVYNIISEVINKYLLPALTAIKEHLQISDIIAGVTLLAFGNGAGDVITAVVASSYPGGVDYNIGATCGANFFLCSVGVYLIIKTSKGPIHVEPNMLWRNVGFQVLSIFIIIFFGVIGQISIFSSLFLFVVYLVLITIVYFQETAKLSSRKKGNLVEKVETVDEAKYDLDRAQEFDAKDLIYLWDHKSPLEMNAKMGKWGQPLNRLNYVSGLQRMQILAKKLHSAVHMTMQQIDSEKHRWSRMTIPEKIRLVIFYPLEIIIKYTLFPVKAEHFDKTHCTIVPIPGTIFVISVVFSFPPWWAYFFGLMFGFAVAIQINSTIPSQKNPPTYFIYLQTMTALICLVWIYIASGMFLDFLQFWQLITQLNKTYLGFSLIAIGNVLPDCLTLINLANDGYAIMALNGIYFGQLFTNLIGFSLAFLKQNLMMGPIKFELFQVASVLENQFKLLVILGSLATLVLTLILAVKNHYLLNKSTGEILLGIYLMFFLIITITAVVTAIH